MKEHAMSACRVVAVALGLVAAACSDPMAAEGLPRPTLDLPVATDGAPQTAVFAMGCFWCAEGIFEQIEGVLDVKSGYAGGTEAEADYELVGGGKTGHAEAIRVTYDPRRIRYAQLLHVFFTTHDPTTKDRQGPDWGRQYRSAVFYQSPAERSVVDSYLRQLVAARSFSRPIVTTLEPLTRFFHAESYHQDYVRNHPDDGYVKMWFPAKQKKLRDHLPSLLKERMRDTRRHAADQAPRP